MSAIGMKAHLKDFATVGFKPILLMVSETAFFGDSCGRVYLPGPL